MAIGNWSAGVPTGTYRNTKVPQYSNYDPITNLAKPGAADEINARNAAALGGGGGTTWWRPGANGGYNQVLNPSDFTGLISAQGALPEYMKTGAGAGAGSGSTHSLAPEIISKMWR
jgi:hypothetical protein